MLSGFMITLRRPLPRLAPLFPAVAVFAALGASACQKVPLLAPSGSTITLVSSATALPLGGSTTILAQVIEASGTPPHEGTQITFTTNLGSIQPNNAQTDANGQVSVTFQAGNQSGTATISALSGGASVSSTGQVKIAIGSASVGRVIVSANPATVSAFGGQTTITANVFDINGNPLPSAPVTFTTTAGTLTLPVVTTDKNGNAQTVLTTAQQATVTASVGAQGGGGTTGGGTTGGGTTGGGTTGGGTTGGGTTGGTNTPGQASAQVTVAVSAAPTLVITPPTTPPSAGLPAAFTFAVTAASQNGSAVRDVTVNWGDGQVQDLGAITGSAIVAHVFNNPGSYTVSATLTDSFGNQVPVSTAVSVIPVPLPTVIITVQSQSGTIAPATVTFQLQVQTPTGVSVQSVSVNWADGQIQNLGGLSGTVTLTHTFQVKGTYTVTVTATDSLGRSTIGTTTVTLS